jgi:hypothetical protein
MSMAERRQRQREERYELILDAARAWPKPRAGMPSPRAALLG